MRYVFCIKVRRFSITPVCPMQRGILMKLRCKSQSRRFNQYPQEKKFIFRIVMCPIHERMMNGLRQENWIVDASIVRARIP